MGEREAGRRGHGLLAEAKDAITPRALLLVVGVGLLQLAFIASYVGAFHSPTPHQIPVAASQVVPSPVGEQTVARLNDLPSRPLRATLVADAGVGLAQLRDRSIYGLLEINRATTTDRLVVASAAGSSTADAVISVLTASEAAQDRTLDVTDIAPPASGDHNGLSAFYLAIGWMIGG
ncbi:MAG: hypothetical protein ACRDNS_22520, partial [Trebonia sp.]